MSKYILSTPPFASSSAFSCGVIWLFTCFGLKHGQGLQTAQKRQGLPGAKEGHRISQKDHHQLQTKSKTRQHSPHPRCHRPLTPQLIKTCHKCHWPPTQSLTANPNTRKQSTIPPHTPIIKSCCAPSYNNSTDPSS